MRLEWGPIISHKRWDKLEEIAKKKPTQQLCDTVAELAIGLTDREDRRPLKRILYILRQAGFTPNDPEPTSKEKEIKNPNAFGFMAAPQRHGYTEFIYGVLDGVKYRHLFALIQERWRFAEVRPGEFPRRSLPELKKSIVSTCPFPIVEVDPGFCLSRIAKCFTNRKHDGVYYPNGFWKRTFATAPEVKHPSVRLPDAHLDSSGRTTHLAAHPIASQWRLALAPSEEVWTDLHAIRWGEAEDKIPLIARALLNARHELGRDEVITEHATRLRDLAYFESVSGDHDSSKRTLAVALNLESRGPESDYFQQVCRWTATDLAIEVEEDEFDVPPISREL